VPEDVPLEQFHLLLEVLNLFLQRGILLSKLIDSCCLCGVF
jgi:Flp pilus assembly protein TadB